MSAPRWLRWRRGFMLHDKNGHEVKVGDYVTVLCKVRERHETEDYCNLTLDTAEPMPPSDNKTSLTLNECADGCLRKPWTETCGPRRWRANLMNDSFQDGYLAAKAKCEEDLERLRQRLAAAEQVIQSVEWSKLIRRVNATGYYNACPVCEQPRWNSDGDAIKKHSATCPLGKFLAALPSPPSTPEKET